jgi:polysaccharide export outer membrane protein
MMKDESMQLRTRVACASMLIALTGCGVVYTVPAVSEQSTAGATYKTDYDVEIVPLTYETAAGANLEPYIPARLPLAFQPDAADTLRLTSVATSNLPSLPQPTARKMTRPGPVADKLPPTVTPGNYRIGVGDVLLLAVSEQATSLAGLPALISAQSKRTGYTVQDDGAIAVPGAGRIQLAGMTLKDAEGAIFQALVAAGIDPSFTLEVAEFHSQRVSVGGMVGKPTLVPIMLQSLNLEEALSLAGGIEAQDPDITRIQIYRDGEIYQIGLASYLNDPGLGKLLLRDGDSIYVGSPYLEAEAQRYYQEQLTIRNEQVSSHRQREADLEGLLARDRSLFEQRLARGAVEQPYAFLTGEVGSTTQVPLPFERTMSLANLLFNKAGGGIRMMFADYGQIYVLRAQTDPQRAGSLTAYHLDAENVANLAVATQFQIHANDIVFVAPQLVTSWNRVFSQLAPQFLLSLPQQVTTP